MKKLIILVTLFLTACESTPPVKKDIPEYNSTYKGRISEVKYKNHNYIIFEDTYVAGYGAGIGLSTIHDPDCPCMKEID